MRIYKNYIKRLLSVILSIICLPFLFVIFIVFAPIIVSEDKGPVFYNAPRLGKNGRIYKMFKFRSMKIDAPDIRNEDGTTFNSEDDPRVTKIGRFLRKTSLEGNDIIGQTTESLVNEGFREVSPIHFFTGRDLFSKKADLFDIEGGMNLLALNQGQEAFRVA